MNKKGGYQILDLTGLDYDRVDLIPVIEKVYNQSNGKPVLVYTDNFVEYMSIEKNDTAYNFYGVNNSLFINAVEDDFDFEFYNGISYKRVKFLDEDVFNVTSFTANALKVHSSSAAINKIFNSLLFRANGYFESGYSIGADTEIYRATLPDDTYSKLIPVKTGNNIVGYGTIILNDGTNYTTQVIKVEKGADNLVLIKSGDALTITDETTYTINVILS